MAVERDILWNKYKSAGDSLPVPVAPKKKTKKKKKKKKKLKGTEDCEMLEKALTILTS
jgi:hypothetical protein